jgi:hypothetical protein
MVVEELTPMEYAAVAKIPLHVFNVADFNLLNKSKATNLYYLVFKDPKPRMGLIAGLFNGELRSPLSAPFGGFSLVKEEISIRQIEEVISSLMSWANSLKFERITITLPPAIYHPGLDAKLNNVFYRSGFMQDKIDLNYAFDLNNLQDDFVEGLRKNARKNLNNALKNNLQFKLCNSAEEQKQAYNIILQNRQSKGYPLRMSWEQVSETIKIIEADFFTVESKDALLAAAMVFHLNDAIVQVVYWGDLADYSHLRPMNFLAYKLFWYYKERGLAFVDIGPSTENSLPNYGLCDFKESIGCDTGLKTTWSYQLK